MRVLFQTSTSKNAVRGHIALLRKITNETDGLLVGRRNAARSRKAFPSSNDLESALVAPLEGLGFNHHWPIKHPQTKKGYEYDFFEPRLGIAVEIMGYRADDEIYKDLLKFHVDEQTKVGAVLVPRWKWIGNEKTETNIKATLKALDFANTYMDIDALVALAYDWSACTDERWRLTYVEAE